MGAKTTSPNREPPVVLDLEGGKMDARDAKKGREVLVDAIANKAMDRLRDRIVDEAREQDRSQTRAAKDRDRATPRDASSVASTRLRLNLPNREEFREALSGRQRKLRSVVKNKVMAAAPQSQHQAVRTMLTDQDTAEWSRINTDLHRSAGNVQKLDSEDRKTVQRLDRMVQSYERLNDREHKVYVAVELPTTHRDVKGLKDLPPNMRPGANMTFDQFTLAKHNLHELPSHDSPRHLVFEIVTSRGAYLGRSDTVEDTTHLLPRAMNMQAVSAEHITYETPGGYNGRIVIQLRERQ